MPAFAHQILPQTAAYGTRELRAGERLFEEGSAGREAYLVEVGEIEIYVARGGRDLCLARRGPGELIGEIAVIDGGSRSASARAATHCRLLVIEAEKLEGRAGASDPVLQMCLGLVVRRYRHAMAQLQALTAGPKHRDDAPLEMPDVVPPEPDPTFARATEVLRQENDLTRGLLARELVLFYQPIVCMRTGRLAGFEALMRWRHPTRGLVPPGNFIPMAEAGGLITELTAWALDEVGHVLPLMIAAGQANQLGVDGMFLSMNVSAADLAKHGFPASVCQTLARAGVPPACLKIEITESMIMSDIKAAAEALQMFESAGIGVAIDDFGTGYSSLSSLATLPISTLKIDRSFVQSMLADPMQYRIVCTIVRLAAELAVPVVAEGIETEAEAASLSALHCDYGQGYLFARPMPQAAMLAAIREWQPTFRTGDITCKPA